MSKFHFVRRFRRVTGDSPLQYVARRRVEVAQKLLMSDGIPLAEVAHLCGYASQSHMTTVFRRLLGVTPGELRRGAAGAWIVAAAELLDGLLIPLAMAA